MTLIDRRHVIAVVTNPSSDNGKGRSSGREAVERLRDRGVGLGFSVADLTGTNREHSLSNIRGALDRIDALVVVGGDGMVSLGVNAVADCDVPLGIVACGSGNDFARSLGLPIGRIRTSTESILAALTYDSSIGLDLGHVRSSDDDGVRINTFFAGMLNCSIDAAINDRANHSRLPFGMLRYLEAGIWEASHVRDYGYHVDVRTDLGTDISFDLVTPLIAIANARYIGSGIEASPDSDLSDGLLEMIWAKWHPGSLQALSILSKAYFGRHTTAPLIGYQRIRDITLAFGAYGEEPPVLMADGEKIGRLPVHVEAHHKALRLLVPPRIGGRLRERQRHARNETLDIR
ncbi:diacylglycerol kinase [Bifidobacterium margollesii]|uniref:Diacylglycerol kinase n=1 Tax=Bifidobacterium margollesii TaxID=2020964 RepID=A0A2N5J9P2_9BIFI|nr:diacylglycerol kinase family protein [Bifidobacterium margollesii]PLS30933.1 diacylglycerol kinase [Bifidobacterium margollesii]